MLVGANLDKIFGRLAKVMGAEALAADDRFRTHEARGANMAELDSLIAQWTVKFPSTVLLGALATAGVPAGRIFSAADIARDPHYLARDMILRVFDPTTNEEMPGPGIVPKLSATPGRVVRGGPTLGQHNEEIYRDQLGVSEAEYASFKTQGVI